MIIKENYFLVDESGNLNNNSKVFVLGCVITDDEVTLRYNIQNFLNGIKNDIYLSRYWKQIDKDGLHACSNHPDIYSRFVQLLNQLNFRAYFVVVDKTSTFFKEKKVAIDSLQFYDECIYILLKDRLVKRKLDSNNIVFEQNTSKSTPDAIKKRTQEIAGVIRNIQLALIEEGHISKDLIYQVKLVDKSDILISVVDYMNHIVSKIYEGRNGKRETNMLLNYQLIEPKIGCIYDAANREFLKLRNRGLDVDNIFIN